MTYVPFAPETAAFYQIIGPDGVIASFNKATDPNYSGALTDISGLDSADVIDSGGTNTQADGGFTGTNWYGRRPITMTIQTYGYSDVATRNAQLARIRRSTNAMRSDATLTWLNTAVGSVQMYTPVRRTTPLRITGGWVKTVNIALTSYMAPLLSYPWIVTGGVSGTATVENQGDYQQGFIQNITITGPTAGTLLVTNSTTGEKIQFLTGLTVPGGQTLSIDTLNHVAYLSGFGWVNNYIDYVNSTWLTMPTGNNVYNTNSGKITITYASAWV